MPTSIYRTKDGERVPGCTTICGQLDKPALLDWAWRCGQEGKDWRETRDSAGDVGTTVHDMILRYYRGEEVAMTGELETKCFEKFLKWSQDNPLTVILIETPLVSENMKYGGTPDLYALAGKSSDLIDFKTGSFDHKNQRFYETVRYQLVGYKDLLWENEYPVDRCRAVYLPKDNGEVYEEIMGNLEAEGRIFRHLVGIYYDRRANGLPRM